MPVITVEPVWSGTFSQGLLPGEPANGALIREVGRPCGG
jgi:hypothetical protein